MDKTAAPGAIMALLQLPENEALLKAEIELGEADAGNLISRCKSYLLLLGSYRAALHDLRGNPEISRHSSPVAQELIEQNRKVVRTAIEAIVKAFNQTESLLRSLTLISGYDAVKTFNQLEYKGSAEWELRANRVRLQGSDSGEQFTMQEAVEAASILRRTAYISHKTTFYE